MSLWDEVKKEYDVNSLWQEAADEYKMRELTIASFSPTNPPAAMEGPPVSAHKPTQPGTSTALWGQTPIQPTARLIQNPFGGPENRELMGPLTSKQQEIQQAGEAMRPELVQQQKAAMTPEERQALLGAGISDLLYAAPHLWPAALLASAFKKETGIAEWQQAAKEYVGSHPEAAPGEKGVYYMARGAETVGLVGALAQGAQALAPLLGVKTGQIGNWLKIRYQSLTAGTDLMAPEQASAYRMAALRKVGDEAAIDIERARAAVRRGEEIPVDIREKWAGVKAGSEPVAGTTATPPAPAPINPPGVSSAGPAAGAIPPAPPTATLDPTINVPVSGTGGFAAPGAGGVPTTKVSQIVTEHITTGTPEGDAFLKRNSGFRLKLKSHPVARAVQNVRQFGREFAYLDKIPDTPEFADIRERFRHSEEIAPMAQSEATAVMTNALKPLKGIGKEARQRQKALELKIIADDMAEEVQRNLARVAKGEEPVALPRNFTEATVATMRQNADYFYNTYPSVRQAYENVRAENMALGNALLKEGLLKAEDARDFYFPHKVMRYLREHDSLLGMPRRPADFKKGYLKWRKGGAEYSTDALQRLLEHWAVVRRDVNYRKWLETTLTEEQSQKFVKNHPTWEKGQSLPEGFKEVTILPGRFYYQAKGVTAELAEAFLDQNLDLIEQLMLKENVGSQVRDLLAVGRKKSYIVRSEVAQQLLDMPTAPVSDNSWYKGVQSFNSFVKQNILVNPLFAIPFHSTNLLGDAQTVLIAAPKAFNRKNLASYWQSIMAARQGQIPERFNLARKYGVTGSGWVGADFGEVQALIPLVERAELSGAAMTVFNKAKYLTNAARKLGAAREDWMRFTVFDYLLDEMEAGKDITRFAVRRSQQVKAIADPTMKAAKVAREIMRDYKAIGKSDRMLAETVAPFWRWTRTNMPWWPRIFATYAKQSEAQKMAWAVSAATMPYAAPAIWNNTGWRRQYEESLPPWKRWSFHIITGKDKLIYTPLPQEDWLDFLGLSDHIVDFTRYQQGQINEKELVWRLFLNTFNNPALYLVNNIGGAAGVMRDVSGVQTFPTWGHVYDWKQRGQNVVKDIFGAPGNLFEAIRREDWSKTKDLMWRSITPFVRPWSNDLLKASKQLGESTYKQTTTIQHQRKFRGQPHKGKERQVDVLRKQLRGREDIYAPEPNQ